MPNRLIIFSTSPAPAWAIDLIDGQAYMGNDHREPGVLTLIIDLDGRVSLTPAQVDCLNSHPDVLRYQILPDSGGCPQSSPQGNFYTNAGEVWHIPHGEDIEARANPRRSR